MIFLGLRTWPGTAELWSGTKHNTISQQVSAVLGPSCHEDDGCVVLVKAGQPQSAGVRVKRKPAVVDGTDELYLRVEDVDNF